MFKQCHFLMMVILATFIKLDTHTMTMAPKVLDLSNEVLNIHFGQRTAKKNQRSKLEVEKKSGGSAGRGRVGFESGQVVYFFRL